MPQPYNRHQPMDDIKRDIKRTAAERAKKLGLPYAGALLPAEAHQLMQAGAKLVDVRTKPELLYVGSIPGSVAIEWQTYGQPAESGVHRRAGRRDQEGRT